MTAGASEEPSDEDLAAVTALIEQSQALKHSAWPESQLASKTLSSSSVESMQEDQRSTLQSIGTAEFAEEAYFNWPKFHEEARAGDGEFVVASEFELLSVDSAGYDTDGNLTVHVKVWSGVTRGSWSDEKAELTSIYKVDATPVWEYVACKKDGVWKLMGQRLIELSEDEDPEYGPETKHVQVPVSD